MTAVTGSMIFSGSSHDRSGGPVSFPRAPFRLVRPSWIVALATASMANAQFVQASTAGYDARFVTYTPIECRTHSGTPIMVPTHGVSHLRRVSGLTWEQIAELFGVSRRAVHHWASGGAMNDENREHLRRLLDVMDRVDRGAAAENREALLIPSGQPLVAPIELLRERRYADAFARLGAQSGRHAPPRVPLSPEATALRRPTVRPDVLIDGRAESVHRDLPGSRRGRGTRRPRGGGERD